MYYFSDKLIAKQGVMVLMINHGPSAKRPSEAAGGDGVLSGQRDTRPKSKPKLSKKTRVTGFNVS